VTKTVLKNAKTGIRCRASLKTVFTYPPDYEVTSRSEKYIFNTCKSLSKAKL